MVKLKDKLNRKSSLPIIIKNISPILISSLQVLFSFRPELLPLFVAVQGMINVYCGEFGQARINELVEDLSKNKDKMDPKILESDKFKTIFLGIMKRHFEEADRRKRKLFRRYLINVACGLYPKFDYHTKIMTILDQITFEELRIIDIWNGKLQEIWIIKNNKTGYTKEQINKEFDEHGLNANQVMFAFENDEIKPTMDQLIQDLRALGNYGLLSVRDTSGAILGGGSEGVNVRITKFGKKFLIFIKND